MAIKTPPQTLPQSVEQTFSSYIKDEYVVNRKYQRKLVWTLMEKQEFIKTLIRGFPIPLIMLVRRRGKASLEILDGLQRLNAIMSFIENEFAVEEDDVQLYFDCTTFTAVKELSERDVVTQKEPRLGRERCRNIAQYQLPLMICEFDDDAEIDQAFRLINSNGQTLSPQELRQAGSTGSFAQLVSHIARSIRGDASLSDVIPLSKAKLISISSGQLEHGIPADDVYWVKNFITDRKMLRRSYDEEIIADILGYMLSDGTFGSSKGVKDSLYNPSTARHKTVESRIQVRGAEVVEKQFVTAHDEVRKLIAASQKTFRALVHAPPNNPVPRYFQIVFLAVWELLFRENRVFVDYVGTANALSSVGQIKIGTGSDWTAEKRQSCVRQVRGFIHQFTTDRGERHPLTENTSMYIERLIYSARIETDLFDFKQGCHDISPQSPFNSGVIRKAVRTLCAITNAGAGTTGYVIFGVCDSASDAELLKTRYKILAHQIGGDYWVTGVDHEIARYNKPDDYFRKITAEIQASPVSARVKSEIELVPAAYFNQTMFVLKLRAGRGPEPYDGTYYQRKASSLMSVEVGDPLSALFERFR